MAQTIKNLASGRLTADITAVATSLSVYVGEGTSTEIEGVWPDTPFYVTIVPNEPDAGVPNSLDSEIVKITAVSSDQNGNTILTATRAQRDTLARAFSAGAIITNAIYVEDIDILDRFYPVGSIYMSATLSTPTQVANALGGTWVAWGAGRVPVGVNSSDADFNTVEKTGGDKDLQKHSHGLPVGNIAYYVGDSSGQANFSGGNACQFWSQDVATNEAGNGSSGNLQPYITCYMYKRTA